MAAADIVGALALCASVCLNISPARDVLDINRTRSVTERSILPYCMMMVDGANWVVYSCLIGDLFPIGLTNAFGCLAGTTYCVVYLRICRNDKREGVRRLAWAFFVGALSVVMLMIIAASVLSALFSADAVEDGIGSFVDIFNVCLYASPLALAWKVFRTGSTSGMYLPLSVCISLASALWATYGYLTSDWFVAAPQSAGLLAGLAQLSLFARYGVADNNEPSAGAPAVVALEPGPRDAPGSDRGATAADEPARLSDASPNDTAAPNSGKSGKVTVKGPLREPLIKKT